MKAVVFCRTQDRNLAQAGVHNMSRIQLAENLPYFLRDFRSVRNKIAPDPGSWRNIGLCIRPSSHRIQKIGTLQILASLFGIDRNRVTPIDV